MNKYDRINFERVREAIEYIASHDSSPLGLEEVAGVVRLSPGHLQRIFTEWAGVSPKKFAQYIRVERAKRLLREEQATLFDTAHQIGLSGTGRLHDLFVRIEGMTPGEYKNGGERLHIRTRFAATPFGETLVASTDKGVCYMAFADAQHPPLEELKALFPKATFEAASDAFQERALAVFDRCGQSDPAEVRLHVKGTEFQIKTWELLLKIPLGQVTTYGELARQLANPGASRAVGSAVGDNPVSFLIPCHRVILSTGLFGQYHWGPERKRAMLGWEGAMAETK